MTRSPAAPTPKSSPACLVSKRRLILVLMSRRWIARGGWLLTAIVIDAALWVGLASVLLVPSSPSDDIDLTDLPLVDLAPDPLLPIVDAPDSRTDQAPAVARAIGQHDFAPESPGQARGAQGTILRRPPPPEKVESKPAAAPTTLSADTVKQPEGPTAAGEPSQPEPLPLIEGTEEVPDVPEGVETAIPTVGDPYAAYMNEVRRAIRSNWRGSEVYRRYPELLSNEDALVRRSELVVRIEPDGTLAEATVTERSGVPALDDEAVSAFARSEPFPAVPPSLRGKGGQLAFRFGLTLDLATANYLKNARGLIRNAWRPHRLVRAIRGSDRVSAVRISVRGDGSIAEAAIEVSSTFSFMDDSLLDTIVRVAKFPSPPPTSLQGGLLKFRVAYYRRPEGDDQLRVYRQPRDHDFLIGLLKPLITVN